MIREDIDQERYLHLFLTQHELEALSSIASTRTNWEKGRQGTGYFKVDIRSIMERRQDGGGHIYDLWSKAMEELAEYARVPFSLASMKWDAYLIYYPRETGTPWHKDPAPEGARHLRLNAVVQSGTSGKLWLSRPFKGDFGVPRQKSYHIEPGDALIFAPSEVEHRVSETANQRPRLVLSVGCLIPIQP